MYRNTTASKRTRGGGRGGCANATTSSQARSSTSPARVTAHKDIPKEILEATDALEKNVAYVHDLSNKLLDHYKKITNESLLIIPLVEELNRQKEKLELFKITKIAPITLALSLQNMETTPTPPSQKTKEPKERAKPTKKKQQQKDNTKRELTYESSPEKPAKKQRRVTFKPTTTTTTTNDASPPRTPPTTKNFPFSPPFQAFNCRVDQDTKGNPPNAPLIRNNTTSRILKPKSLEPIDDPTPTAIPTNDKTSPATTVAKYLKKRMEDESIEDILERDLEEGEIEDEDEEDEK